MVGTLQGAIKLSIAIALNDRYRYGSYDCPNRCYPLQSGCSDCSGLVVASWHSQGAASDIDCTGSFAIARLCHQKGLGVPLNQTRPGDLLYIGANQGQGALNGSKDGIWPGHIARKAKGPAGQSDWVVEARNHRAGIVYAAAFYNRGWDWASRDPFLSDLTPDPPVPPKPKDEFMRAIPIKKAGVPGNAQPVLIFDPNGGPTGRGVLLSYNGAKVKWDVNTADAPLGGDRDPKTIGIPGGSLKQLIFDVTPLTATSEESVRICAYGAQAGQWYGTAHS